MSTIGIGVTTFRRPKHLALWLSQVEAFTEQPYSLYIANDSVDRRGIAYRKTECLSALRDCDFIFLFDDDCFPISEGWTDFFIQSHKSSGNDHFIYLKETSSIVMIEEKSGIQSFNNCGGTFLFLTKTVIERVGGFHKGYGLYGFEHAGFSQRIHAAGLTPSGHYLCPSGAGAFIYAMDYDSHLPFNKKVDHRSSITVDEALFSLEKNKTLFETDLKSIYQKL